MATVAAPEQHVVRFCFQINGTSDPDFCIPGKGMGVTDVKRTGVGVFDIYFDSKYPVFLYASGGVMGPDGGSAVNDQSVKTRRDAYVASTGVLTVTVVDAGTAAAADPTDNSWVWVEAVFCRRSKLSPSTAI